MNLNNDLVKYDDNVLKCNLMFFTRINNIVNGLKDLINS